MTNDEIDHSIGHQQWIKVLNVTFELVIETAITKAVEYFFSCLDGMLRE